MTNHHLSSFKKGQKSLAISFVFALMYFFGILISPHFAHAASCGTYTTTDSYGNTYGTVVGADGNCWLDRNLGATEVANSSTDYHAYGSQFQWGRLADGHELINWTSSTVGNPVNGTTTTLSSADVPGNNNFIIAPSSPYDWRSPQNSSLWQGLNGINNPCPTGFRLPTQTEWSTLVSAAGITNSATAYSSSLKLTAPGYRDRSSGSLVNQGGFGYYWSSSVSGSDTSGLYFDSSSVSPSYTYNRAFGLTVRCMKTGITFPSSPTITPGLTTSSLTPTSVTLNATSTADASASTTIQGFNYGTSISYGSVASTTGTFGSGTFSQSITGLTCNTLYHFQAFATNSIGTGTSTDQTFTTPICPVATAPTPAPVQSFSSSGGSVSVADLAKLLAPGPATEAYLKSRGYETTIVAASTLNNSATLPASLFTRSLTVGSVGNDVKALQVYLNTHGFALASTGPGSLGNETSKFGPLTKLALIKFQTANHITPSVGYFGPITRGVIVK